MIAVAIAGIAFGALSTFVYSLAFAPLGALCAAVALIGGVVQRRFAVAFLAIVAAVLTGVGSGEMPNLWPVAAAMGWN